MALQQAIQERIIWPRGQGYVGHQQQREGATDRAQYSHIKVSIF
jgi:hypothetical protein